MSRDDFIFAVVRQFSYLVRDRSARLRRLIKFPAKYKKQGDRFEITGVTKREPRPSRRAFSAQTDDSTKRPRAHVSFSCEYRRDLRTLSSLEKPLSISHLACLLSPHLVEKRVKFQTSVSSIRITKYDGIAEINGNTDVRNRRSRRV